MAWQARIAQDFMTRSRRFKSRLRACERRATHCEANVVLIGRARIEAGQSAGAERSHARSSGARGRDRDDSTARTLTRAACQISLGTRLAVVPPPTKQWPCRELPTATLGLRSFV